MKEKGKNASSYSSSAAKTQTNRKVILFLLGFMGFWVMGDNYAAAPLLVNIAADFGLDIGTAALTVPAYMIPFGLFTFVFGPLGDRYGKEKIINFAAFGTAIFSSLGAVAFNIQSLAAIRAINGIFASAILPVTISLIGDLFSQPKSRLNAIGTVMGVYFLGAAAATAIGGGLSYLGSWRLVYLIYGLAELIIALAMIKYFAFSGGDSSAPGIFQAYSGVLQKTNLIKTVKIIFLGGFAVFGSFTYLGDFLAEQTGFNILIVGFILTLFGLAAYTGGRFVGNLRQKFGRKVLIAAGIIGFIVWSPMGFWPGLAYVFVALPVFGTVFVILQSSIVGSAQQQLPEQRGLVMSLASFNMFLGGGSGVFVNRILLNTWGYHIVFLVSGLTFMTAGYLAYKLNIYSLASHD
ncbi:MFS transporter [Halarsenatibacter silvermanii]|uniref:Predicted arabinose efflux permease, MFS family n=1 Tax=Halarsenatibacter silvermanii TaxID=321763 RepID=A0A1G9S0Z4_9FIRM|nr:MFS transporter [Halarsenatibacter silvermanii]SDM29218.1 Predicted arabinose efflux permease, MFS family [Halarsenatibacter silvermanii]